MYFPTGLLKHPKLLGFCRGFISAGQSSTLTLQNRVIIIGVIATFYIRLNNHELLTQVSEFI